MPALYVNLDHVATLRKARGTLYPDILEAARLVESEGVADGITLHLREDRRHVDDEDVRRVAEQVGLPFNYECSVAEDIVALGERLAPPQATLVPERREEVTTEGGLDLERNAERIAAVIARFRAVRTEVSLFVDPSQAAVLRSAQLGAQCIELHTGRYAEATTVAERASELSALRDAALAGREAGLTVHAGHGLNIENVAAVAAIPGLSDLNIGHAIVARAVFLGLPEALREMRRAMESSSPVPPSQE